MTDENSNRGVCCMDATFWMILMTKIFVLLFLVVMYIYSIRLEDESDIKDFNGKID